MSGDRPPQSVGATVTDTARHDGTLFGALAHSARECPDPAVVVPGGESITYGQLHAAALERAAALDRLPAAGVVGIGVTDPVDFVAWTLAVSRRGRSAFLVHADLTDTELRGVAGAEGATALVVDAERDAFPGQLLRSTRLHVPDPAGSGPAARRDGAADLHFYTSGTDGLPKGAIKDGQRLLEEGRTLADVLGYQSGTRVLTAVPLCHAYGFAFGFVAVLLARGTLVAARPRSAAAFGQCVREHRIDVVVGVPSLYDTWSRGDPAPSPAAGPRLCVSAGAALPDGLASRFEQRWGVGLTNHYGATECGAITIAIDGPGGVGRPFPGVEVRAGSRGSPAEVVVRSRYAAEGYVNAAEHRLKPNPFTAEGVRVGDMGWLDEAGRLHLTGRRTDTINVHGRKVGVAEVENVLRSHPAVTDVVVLGQDTAADQWIAAFVVTDVEATELELFAFCQDRLARYKVPRRFFPVDEIPRTATGKPRRGLLRERIGG
jgi:acyl-coenzyme A synthetase/AMP-(fatty) acid ligase